MTEWKEYQIGDLLKLEYGKGLTGYRNNKGKYKVYGTNGAIGTTNSFLYDKKSLVIGRKGAYREVHLADSPFFVIDTAFYTKQLNELSDTLYMYYWFKNVDINSMDSGSAIPSTSRDEIYELEILLPPITEQRAIASILSSLDDKIDLLYRQNKTLEEMAETLFRQWFVVETPDIKLLGDCIKTTSGGTPSRTKMEYYDNGIYQWIKSKELNGGYILETEEKITEEALKNSSAKLLPENSVLIAMYGATVGQFAIIGQEATCNQAICACVPNDSYPYTFIYHTIKFNVNELKSRAVGSAQQNISQVLIKSLDIAVNDNIGKFHLEVDPMMKKIKSNYKQIRTLEKLRDTLLPKLMSGEVKVSIDEFKKEIV